MAGKAYFSLYAENASIFTTDARFNIRQLSFFVQELMAASILQWRMIERIDLSKNVVRKTDHKVDTATPETFRLYWRTN